MGKVRRGQPAQSITDLPTHNVNRISSISLGERLTNACNHFQTAFDRGASLLFNGLIRLTEKLPAFRVTDDGVTATDVHEHFHGYFARKRPLLFPVHILSRDRDARAPS